MVNRVWPVDAVSGAPAYSGRALRQSMMAPLLAGATAARPLGAISGVRPGTPDNTVTATSTLWTVRPHAGVLDVQTAPEAGPYGYAIDANVTGAVTAAHATYTRWDGIYVQLSDPGEGDGTPAPGVAVVYVAGAPAAAPAMPAQPARSILLARIVVPKSGSGAPSVVWLAPIMAVAGGVRHYNSVGELPAGLAPSDSGIVAVIGSGASYREYRWNGAAWVAPMRQQGVTNLPAQTIAAAGGAGYVTVTFPVPFDSVPQVFVNINAGPGASSNLVPRALSITASGFGAYVYNVHPSAAAVLSSSLELGWLASV